MTPQRKVTTATVAVIALLFLSVIPVLAAATEVTTDKSTYFVGEAVTITGKTDPNALVGIQVTNPLGTNILLVGAQADSSGVFTRVFRLPTDAMTGAYTVSADGKVATFQVAKDTTAPVIANIVFDKPGYQPSDTVTFTVQVSDDAAVASVTSDVSTMTLASGTQKSGTWTASIKAPASAGSYYVTITASDFSGNVAAKTGTYRVVALGGQMADLQVGASGTYFPGDTARIWIMTTFNGTLVDPVVTGKHIFVPGATGPADLGTLNKVMVGMSYVDYSIAKDAKDGLYAVRIAVIANGTAINAMGTFQVTSKIATAAGVSGQITAAQTAITSKMDVQSKALADMITAAEANIRKDVSALSTKLDGAQAAVIGAVGSAANDVKNSVSSAQSAITTKVSDVQGALSGAMTTSSNEMKKAVSDSQSAIMTSVNSIGSTVNNLSGTLTSINQGLSQVSTWLLVVGALAAIILVVTIVMAVRRK